MNVLRESSYLFSQSFLVKILKVIVQKIFRRRQREADCIYIGIIHSLWECPNKDYFKKWIICFSNGKHFPNTCRRMTNQINIYLFLRSNFVFEILKLNQILTFNNTDVHFHLNKAFFYTVKNLQTNHEYSSQEKNISQGQMLRFSYM